MFKSIFSKYITAVSIIVVLSFLILATVLTAVIGDYGKSDRQEEVEHISSLTAEIVTHGYPDGSGLPLGEFLASRPSIEGAIEAICHEDAKTSVFVMDGEKNILLSSHNFHEKAEAVIADTAYWNRVATFLSAGKAYRETESVTSLGGGTHIVYITPFTDSTGAFLGCVYAATSIESVEQITKATTQTVVMACLWVMLAVLVAVYFITERHIDPIRRMSRAAKGYAKGDFSERVESVGGDEIAELAAALNYMAGELDSLEQKRNRFISDVSHELRSPMTSMLGFVEAVVDGTLPPEKQRYYLSLVAEEIKRLSRLVADLLDVSRLEMGERKMNFAKYDLADNAATVLISLEQRINDKALDVSFESEEERLFVCADADAMYRVLYNLIENAVKFSKQGGKLSVTLSIEEGRVRCEIYNEGIGISKEDLPNIFDRFYKSDKSRGEDKKGVGLGLYFVKTIVSAHGGEIRAESREGIDTRFIMELPLYKESKSNTEND